MTLFSVHPVQKVNSSDGSYISLLYFANDMETHYPKKSAVVKKSKKRQQCQQNLFCNDIWKESKSYFLLRICPLIHLRHIMMSQMKSAAVRKQLHVWHWSMRLLSKFKCLGLYTILLPRLCPCWNFRILPCDLIDLN